MKKIIYSILFSMTVLTSCKNNAGNAIKCNIKNAAEGQAILMDLSPQKLTPKDTAIVKNGVFEFENSFTQSRIASVKFSDGKQFVFVVNPKEKIEIEGDINVPNSMIYKGSPESQTYNDVVKASSTGNQAVIKSALDSVKSPLVGLLLASMLPLESNADAYQKVATQMNAKHPGSDYATHINGQMAQLKSQTATASGTEAPEIELPNPEGKMMKLSSLKGKVVLIDFWASWCRPCRMENPNVVKAYNQYKDKGFTIMSVSLDNDKKKWEDAIKADNLTWPYHVSELKGWQSMIAKTYAVNSIPRTFLLDKEGKIVASNLRGPALEEKLAELLK